MSGPARVLVEDLPRRRRDPGGDLGPFGVPPWGGKDQSDPRKRGTANECVRNKANLPAATGAGANGRGRRRSRRWDRRYKQSQFADMDRDGRGPAKAPAEPSLGAIAQTNPICPAPAGKALPGGPQALPTLGASASNKANFHGQAGMGEGRQIGLAGAAGPKRAKQSQFPTERQEEQVLGRTRVVTNRTRNRPRPNKANFRPDRNGRGPGRLPVPPVEPSAPNKAN